MRKDSLKDLFLERPNRFLEINFLEVALSILCTFLIASELSKAYKLGTAPDGASWVSGNFLKVVRWNSCRFVNDDRRSCVKVLDNFAIEREKTDNLRSWWT